MKLLLAVSGGIDSMTMADMMFSHSRLCPVHCDEIALAHCNFHLRPGDCDQDEALVRNWAEERSIPFFKADFDTRGYALQNSVSIEMAARELRYKWFSEICHEHGYDGVATAHHADDNAETLMLNIVRGTGLRGICGMTETDRLPYDGKLLMVRPLLKLSRAEIEAYASAHQVPWRLDKTNSGNECRRNVIRNQVFPLLKEMNPSLVRTIARDMEHFRQAQEIIGLWFEERSSIIHRDGCNETLNLAELLCIRGWEYFLWYWLEGKGFREQTLEKLAELIMSPDGTFAGKTFKGDGWDLVTASESLVLARTDASAETMDIIVTRIPVAMLPKGDDGKIAIPKEGCLYLDAERIGNYEARRWQDGDWFIPLGMKGKKKISDWFTDKKFSLPQKEAAVILAPSGMDTHHVAAILSPKACRQDESTRINEGTTTVLCVSLDL